MSDTKAPNLSDLIRQHEAFCSAVARAARYKPDAFAFVCEGVNYTCARLGSRRDVTGAELVNGLCDLAVEHFGYLAPTVLQQWGVTRSEDFGEIVFALVEVGLLGKSSHDSMADFANLCDLRTTLRERYRIEADPEI